MMKGEHSFRASAAKITEPRIKHGRNTDLTRSSKHFEFELPFVLALHPCFSEFHPWLLKSIRRIVAGSLSFVTRPGAVSHRSVPTCCSNSSPLIRWAASCGQA